MTTAIEVDDVSKRFRLYHEKYTSLKERAIHFGKVPFDEFRALDHVSMTIEQGETVGLLGHNGCGKSTLLKCVAAILRPTTGQIRVRGRLAAILELGAGFHPELSGRDNIYLNGSLLGMSTREIAKRFDEIVEFAELERFIDNQVKYYSSGMYTRLGFSVAVTMEPDILLVDEVLAVGDESFQRKCIERVRRFQAEGRTIMFVSHAPDLVRQICDRVYVIDHGKVIAEGQPGEAIRTFRAHLLESGLGTPEAELEMGDPSREVQGSGDSVEALSEAEAATQASSIQAKVTQSKMEALANRKIRISEVEIIYASSNERPYLLPDESMTVRVHYQASTPVEDPHFGIAIYDVRGELVYGTNTEIMGENLGTVQGSGHFDFDFPSIPLLDGTYPITLGIHSRDGGTVYDWQEQRCKFEVMSPDRRVGVVALAPQIRVGSGRGRPS
jgi:ABC-type polysaccharide/polyol phosphate transport system ATPase subunit